MYYEVEGVIPRGRPKKT